MRLVARQGCRDTPKISLKHQEISGGIILRNRVVEARPKRLPANAVESAHMSALASPAIFLVLLQDEVICHSGDVIADYPRSSLLLRFFPVIVRQGLWMV